MEALDACLQQIRRRDAELHAVCTLDDVQARQTASAADEVLAWGEVWGALHGLPITIKDVLETAGLRTTAGHWPLKDHVPTEDAVLVARLRRAGAVILGKTNPAELASDWQGINSVFPRVNNSWNLDCTPGGSSSGSAAAIASGFSALEIGDDFEGSVRQPAHFCGIYSLKTTDRRVPTLGHIPEMPGAKIRCIRQMLAVGPMARSIPDLRLVLRIIAGPDCRQPSIPPVPLDSVAAPTPQALRIAWADEVAPFPVDSQIKAALRAAVNQLGNAGAVVESWQPQLDFAAAWRIGFEASAYNTIHAYPSTATGLDKLAFIWREATQGDSDLRQLGNIPRMAIPIFLCSSLKGYFETLTQRDRLIAEMDQALAP